MNRLDVRLIVSHLLVAVLGAIATYVIVRQLAPAIFDESVRMTGMGGMGGPAQGGAGALREQFADAVDSALLVGALVGALAAALFGTFAAYRLIRPLAMVRAATREMAQGRYAVPVPIPARPSSRTSRPTSTPSAVLSPRRRSAACGCSARWRTRCAPR